MKVILDMKLFTKWFAKWSKSGPKVVQKWFKVVPKAILRASLKAEIVLNNLYFISKLLVQSSFMEFKEFGKCKQCAYLVFFLILS